MNAERWARRSGARPSSGPPEPTASNARFNGQAPSVWTVSMRGESASAPSAAASAKAWMQALASAPPPTWTTTRSSGTPEEASSQPRVSPPSIASPFRFPWHVKGRAPSSSARRSRRYAGSPAGAVALAQRDARIQLLEPLEHDGSASTGTKTRSARPPAAATTAAASAAFPQLAIASSRSGESASPIRSATSRWTSTPKRWRALCEPETLPVSSLTQTPPVRQKPRARLSSELRGRA